MGDQGGGLQFADGAMIKERKGKERKEKKRKEEKALVTRTPYGKDYHGFYIVGALGGG
jgi:hypothetical protein